MKVLSRDEVRRILLGMGVPPGVKGFSVMVEAIKMLHEDESTPAMALYEGVARRLGGSHTKSRVERNMRYTKQVIVNSQSPLYKDIEELFGGAVDKLSLSHFLSLIVQCIKMGSIGRVRNEKKNSNSLDGGTSGYGPTGVTMHG